MNKVPSEIDLEDIFNQHISDQDVKAHRRITPPGFADDAVGYRDDHRSQLPTFPFPDQVYLQMNSYFPSLEHLRQCPSSVLVT